MSWLTDALGTAGNVMTGGLGGMAMGALGGGGGGGAPPAGQPQYPASYGTQTFGASAWPNYGQPGATPAATHFTGDFSQPGAAEKFFSEHEGQWGNPGTSAAQTWWNQNKDKFGAGPADQFWNGIAGRAQTQPQGSNLAKTAWDQFQAGTPADMGSYYDNAARKAQEGIDRAYAARGMRGSSAELDQTSEAMTNLRAQQAKDEAAYGLQRAGLAGNLGTGADVSNARDVQNQLGWMTGLGGLATGVQGADTARLLGAGGLAGNVDNGLLSWLGQGMTGAIGAQNAAQGRGQDFFNNTLAATQAQTNPELAAYLAMLNNDQALQQAGISASLGGSREALNQSVQGRAQTEQGIGNFFNLGGGTNGAGGLGQFLMGSLG